MNIKIDIDKLELLIADAIAEKRRLIMDIKAMNGNMMAMKKHVYQIDAIIEYYAERMLEKNAN